MGNSNQTSHRSGRCPAVPYLDVWDTGHCLLPSGTGTETPGGTPSLKSLARKYFERDTAAGQSAGQPLGQAHNGGTVAGTPESDTEERLALMVIDGGLSERDELAWIDSRKD